MKFYFRCRNIRYDTDLPTTTIIICFHNEGRAALLRTVVRFVYLFCLFTLWFFI